MLELINARTGQVIQRRFGASLNLPFRDVVKLAVRKGVIKVMRPEAACEASYRVWGWEWDLHPTKYERIWIPRMKRNGWRAVYVPLEFVAECMKRVA